MALWTLTWLHRLSVHVSWITWPYQNTILRQEHHDFHSELKGLILPNTNLLRFSFTLLYRIYPCGAEITNVWFYASTSSYTFMAKYLIKHSDNFIFFMFYIIPATCMSHESLTLITDRSCCLPKHWFVSVLARCRWEDNIKMDLQEVGWGGMDWIDMAQGRDRWRAFVSAVMNPRVPQNAGNFLTSWGPVSFSRRSLLHGVS
jgi:hypothetical protein